MEWNDVIYILLLVVNILVGPYIRKIENVQVKKKVSACLGLAIALTVSGWHVVHPLFVTLCNAAIILLIDKRYCHNVSFVFCFAYLAFFRVIHHFGLPEPAPHLNAIEMIHTLKMVGLAFEVRDTHQKESQLKQGDQRNVPNYEYEYTKVHPSFWDIFDYSFCHAGFLTGPYFKFRTYWDWLHLPFSTCAPATSILYGRLLMIPFFAVAYLIGNYIYPLSYTESEIYTTSFLYRWWYMTPLFFNFRMRLYIGFGLSECSCIAAGLGLYPSSAASKPGQGPVNYEKLRDSLNQDEGQLRIIQYDSEAVHNIDEYGAEFVPTVREGMRCWNMTVQYWLAVFVHKRVKVFRVAITMLTSAFWHGVYPGYYLCLLTVPFVLLAEDSMDRALRREASSQGKTLYDWICWVFKMQAFSYMGMAFYLLQVDETLRFWNSLYFGGHVLVVGFYLLGQLIQRMKGGSSKVCRPTDDKGRVKNDHKL